MDGDKISWQAWYPERGDYSFDAHLVTACDDAQKGQTMSWGRRGIVDELRAARKELREVQAERDCYMETLRRLYRAEEWLTDDGLCEHLGVMAEAEAHLATCGGTSQDVHERNCTTLRIAARRLGTIAQSSPEGAVTIVRLGEDDDD